MIEVMRRVGMVFVLIGSLLLAGASMSAAHAAPADPAHTVVELRLKGVVDPFVASYIKDAISDANRDGNVAVLLTIDTPGGLDSSMREITQAVLNSKVPVMCFTAPSGARAASAGTFVMLACPVNAMAPGTNIGAAHPVGVSGVIEQAKVTNDAAAYIRSLAERWGRDADWAEKAVRDSVSISAQEARSLNVVDYVVGSVPALFQVVGCTPRSLNPRTPPETEAEILFRHPVLCGATVEQRGMGFGIGLLHGIIDPNFAFLFFFAGIALIVLEILHPGISVPGIVGTLLLVTSVISFGFLPVRLGGIVLLVASAVFFLLELKHPGIGLPTIGGLVSLVLGGLLLFDPAVPNARVSPWVLAAVALMLGLFFGVVVRAVVKTKRLPPHPTPGQLEGELGVAVDHLAPQGRVRVRQENWSAQSIGPAIEAGTPIRVLRMDGLRLVVEPAINPPVELPATRTPARSATSGGRPGSGRP
jgi:membrane-bound serine protease (ClpP class)